MALIKLSEVIKQLQEMQVNTPEDITVEVRGYDDGEIIEYNIAFYHEDGYKYVTQNMLDTIEQ